MKIAYHFMVPEPPRPELDGAVQEAVWLRERFGGSISFLYPLGRFSRLVPSRLCGLGSIGKLRKLDRGVDLHHLFTPSIPNYPFLAALRKPCICTVQTSQGERTLRAPASTKPRVVRLVASDPRDVPRLEHSTGIPTIWIPPGVDTGAFRRSRPPKGGDFSLLVGSAPWTRRQFSTKGIDQLLAAARAIPRLRLVFLWRGVLLHDLKARIDRAGLGTRVEVITETTDVARLLTRVHAVAVLADRPQLIKAFPHSALEALAAGRPVLTSSVLGLADLVSRQRAGVVLDSLSPSSVLAGLQAIMENYEVLAEAAMALDLSEFSRTRFLDAYGRIYRDALRQA